jgi:hypothetical protein
MTRSVTIRWEALPDEVARVTYFVDDEPVGDDDDGFDRILDLIRAEEDTDVVLRIQVSPSLGGGRLTDSFPFHSRLDELQEAVGDNAITYDFG